LVGVIAGAGGDDVVAMRAGPLFEGLNGFQECAAEVGERVATLGGTVG
jgi:hypothetical protein